MKRYDDWPTRLDRFLAKRMHCSFAWGSHDCCLFACDAIEAMTGEDLAAEFRRQYQAGRDDYHTASGAQEMLRRAGACSIGSLAERILELRKIREIPPSFAQRGDLVLLHRALVQGETLGIVSLAGTEAWAPGDFGLVATPLGHALRAWRI